MRSVAALNGNAVTESSGLWILVGADLEIHLADALTRHLLEGAEHPAGAHGRLQLFISHLAVAAVAEFEEGLNGVAARERCRWSWLQRFGRARRWRPAVLEKQSVNASWLLVGRGQKKSRSRQIPGVAEVLISAVTLRIRP